jgi:hypothetical protein
MGFIDKAKGALTDAVDQHGDKIAGGIDKAAEAIDNRTGGKHADKIATGASKAKDALDGMDGRDDDIRAASPIPEPAPPRPSPTRPSTTEPAPDDGGGLTEPGVPTDPRNPTG